MKKQFILLLSFILFSLLSYSQRTTTSYEFQSKYHMLDSSELYAPRVPGKSFTQTAPPTGIVRAIPEWDPAEAVIISYPGNFGLPYPVIAELSQDCHLITIVESSSQQTTVTSNYNSNGVNVANCSFIIAPLDTYWSRDYGPWFIMVNDSVIAIVDFPYNRPRPNDDNVPVVMGSYLNETVYGMNLVQTGGNYMVDGMGVAAMTNLVNDDNTTLSDAQIDTLMKQYLGISTNYITADPLGAYIKHIDCWGKFLDVDKILIASVPVSNSQYSAYEAMAVYWANEVSSYGDYYKVYRTYEPNGEPYSNSLILNKKVFLPIMGGSSATNDSMAIAVYQNAMPGYEVLGFTGLSGAAWVSTDALHCRTHEVADQKMLYIKHYPLLGEKPNQLQYLVSADIFALSDSSLVADSVWIKYRVNLGSWNLVLLTNTSGNTWQANIPQQSPGDTVEYYIHASDRSPKSVTHPLIGAPDPHKFWIGNANSIAEISNEKTLIFPNPANTDLFIFLRNQSEAKGVVRIYNEIGCLVKEVDIADYPDKFIKLNVSDFAPGSYIINVQTEKKVKVSKVVIMH